MSLATVTTKPHLGDVALNHTAVRCIGPVKGTVCPRGKDWRGAPGSMLVMYTRYGWLATCESCATERGSIDTLRRLQGYTVHPADIDVLGAHEDATPPGRGFVVHYDFGADVDRAFGPEPKDDPKPAQIAHGSEDRWLKDERTGRVPVVVTRPAPKPVPVEAPSIVRTTVVRTHERRIPGRKPRGNDPFARAVK
jgi:hypothetical protein